MILDFDRNFFIFENQFDKTNLIYLIIQKTSEKSPKLENVQGSPLVDQQTNQRVLHGPRQQRPMPSHVYLDRRL